MRYHTQWPIICGFILTLSISACQHQADDPAATSSVNDEASVKLMIKNKQQRHEKLEYASDQPPRPLPSPSLIRHPNMPRATSPNVPHAVIRPADEQYPDTQHNRVISVSQQPVSTFSIDVDTAAYSNVRRFLNSGKAPNTDAVRIEEMINYFTYDYPDNDKNSAPFNTVTEVGPSPWNPNKQLIHIGIQGKKIQQEQRPATNLVFLIDVSGSMHSANKLGLLTSSLKMLSRQLRAEDTVSIVVYAGAAGVALPATAGNQPQVIINALDQLSAGGSTDGSAGIHAAYQLAEENFIKNGINRIMIATDGDFNVGTVDEKALKQLIEEKRQSGISLSVLGFGRGNYNDRLMQTLAQNGNGNAYYIDNLQEAHKVLVEELSATLVTIAKDVKIQVEFNPSVVSEYQLIGYETRQLNREDFNNDNVDAGEIGAGHTVTAIYEIALVGAKNSLLDDLRYGDRNSAKSTLSSEKDQTFASEIAFLRLRYKQPEEEKSQLISTPIYLKNIHDSIDKTSENYRFSAAVAAFGQLLRQSTTPSTMTYNDIITLANSAKGKDNNGYRAEFVQLVKLAEQLKPQIAGH